MTLDKKTELEAFANYTAYIKRICEVKKCTLCKEPFGDGGRFPYPEKQVLCKKCFRKSLSKGIANLNRILREEISQK